MTELEKLRAENAYLRDLLERWVRQYGYREPNNVVKLGIVNPKDQAREILGLIIK